MQTAPRLPARVVLSYLAAVQEGDGRWPQNMWLDGTAYWGGVQLDECAFPILLIHLLLREKILEPSDADRFTEWSCRCRVHRAQRSGDATGPLGGRRRSLSIYA
jgi:glucoamylase